MHFYDEKFLLFAWPIVTRLESSRFRSRCCLAKYNTQETLMPSLGVIVSDRKLTLTTADGKDEVFALVVMDVYTVLWEGERICRDVLNGSLAVPKDFKGNWTEMTEYISSTLLNLNTVLGGHISSVMKYRNNRFFLFKPIHSSLFRFLNNSSNLKVVLGRYISVAQKSVKERNLLLIGIYFFRDTAVKVINIFTK